MKKKKRKRKKRRNMEHNKWDLPIEIPGTIRGAFQSPMPLANWPGVIDFTVRYRGQKMEVSHSLGPLGLVECSG